MGGLLEREPLHAQQVVHDVGDDLGVGLKRALVAEHLDEAAVGIVGRDLAVVHHRVVEQGEGMRAAPPAGRVGGVAPMRRPAIAAVFLQAIEHAHVLGVSHGLEGSHVLAAREDVGTLHLRVDPHDDARHELALVELQVREHRRQRRHEIAPYDGLVGDGGDLARGDVLRLGDLEVLLEERLALLARGARVEEEVQGIELLVLRVDAIGGKASAQTVRALVHGLHGPHDLLARHAPPLAGDDRGDGAARRDADLSFSFHGRPFEHKKGAHRRTGNPMRTMNAFAHLRGFYARAGEGACSQALKQRV